jgi:hypothetical protein
MAKRILGLHLHPRSSRSLHLWFGFLGPPVAWGLHVVLGDGIFELGCARAFEEREILGVPLPIASIIETTVLAAITALAGVVAYLAWRDLRKERDGTSHGRAMAMAVMGMAQGAFYFAIIAFQFLPPILLRDCEIPL